MRRLSLLFILCASSVLAFAVEPLKFLDELCSLQMQPLTCDHPFSITGQVMLICNTSPRRINLIWKRSKFPVTLVFWDLNTNAPAYHVGDILHAEGFCSRSYYPNVKREQSRPTYNYLTNYSIVSNAPLPPATDITAREVNNGERGEQPVRVSGVLASAISDPVNSGWNKVILNTKTGKLLASASDYNYPLHSLRELIDAEVYIQGFQLGLPGGIGPYGRHLVLYGQDGIVVTKASPRECPFHLPASTPLFPRTTVSLHRQKITGHVIGFASGKVFLRTADGMLVEIALKSNAFALGTPCIATGFVEQTPMGRQMTEAMLTSSGGPRLQPETPIRINPEKLFTTDQGNLIIDTTLYGKTVEIEGRVANSTEGIHSEGHILLECGMRTFDIDALHLMQGLPSTITTDFHLRIIGICLPEFTSDRLSETFPQFKRFVIVPRTADDIVIVSRPPWWTPGKLLIVILLLALAIIAFLVWNRMLKVLSERRGRELAEEQITSARADLKVEERTRLAIELHDSISQTLTGVALQIDAATKTGKANPSAAERFLGTARTMLASCRQELRCCIWDLKSRTFDEKDMTEAVQKTLAPHVGDTELHVRFNVPRSILSESATHDTLRIVRELAVNALRHGQARHLRVAGEHKDGYVRFSVQDDGKGFDPATLPGPADGHFGLQGIRERVKNRNGELHIESAVGTGTKVTVTLLADEKDEDEK